MRLALEILIIAAGAIAVLVLVPHAPRRRRPTAPERSARRPEDLERLERLVSTGHATAFSVHARLRPTLRELAAARLRRHGVRLDAEPTQARALLGAHLYELVRPDRPIPEDRVAKGISREQLEAMVDKLESL